jgi:hypothetical protein
VRGIASCQRTQWYDSFNRKVSDGARTHDRLDHNQELYQLSYAHRDIGESTSPRSLNDVIVTICVRSDA